MPPRQAPRARARPSEPAAAAASSTSSTAAIRRQAPQGTVIHFWGDNQDVGYDHAKWIASYENILEKGQKKLEALNTGKEKQTTEARPVEKMDVDWLVDHFECSTDQATEWLRIANGDLDKAVSIQFGVAS